VRAVKNLAEVVHAESRKDLRADTAEVLHPQEVKLPSLNTASIELTSSVSDATKPGQVRFSTLPSDASNLKVSTVALNLGNIYEPTSTDFKSDKPISAQPADVMYSDRDDVDDVQIPVRK